MQPMPKGMRSQETGQRKRRMGKLFTLPVKWGLNCLPFKIKADTNG